MFRQVVRDNPRLRPADAAMIEQLCQALWLARAAFDELSRLGPDGRPNNLLERDTAHGDGQEMRRHPLWMAWRSAQEQLRAAAQQLGATPMARARLPDEEPEGPSLAEILFGVGEPSRQRHE